MEAQTLDRQNQLTRSGRKLAVPTNAPRLDENSIILVGERAAALSGTLSAVLRLRQRTGARVAWVPRRAGDRGAVEAGCLPNLLPGGRPLADPAARVDPAAAWGIDSLPSLEGRDADEMLISASDDELAALVVAGIDPTDFADPQAVLEGLEEVDFVVSLETRASLVTERADVVLPVSLMHERAGTFVNWEGRPRPFDVVIDQPNGLSDLRVLAALADGLGTDLGFRTPAQARAELAELGLWEGERGRGPRLRGRPGRLEPGEPADGATPVVLATWRMALDASRALDGDPTLQATAPVPVARLSPATAAAAGIGTHVEVANDRGALTLPVVVDETMVDGVVWLPGRAAGFEVPEHLAAGAGDLVTIRPPANLVPAPRRPGRRR